MKNIQLIKTSKILFLALFILTISGCEREPSEDVRFATFSKTGDIFTDTFIGLGSNFYFPFVGDGAKPDVFSVDESEAYQGEASIRIDVPNATDPSGNFAGASFVIDGTGRNLTDFDALTFWAKGSQAGILGEVGFGLEYRAAASNVQLSTSWQQYIIPIPDPSVLIEERNVFEFSAGGIDPDGVPNGNEVGWTFWIDELRFEKLGTIAQPRPSILEGQDIETETFIGVTLELGPFTETFNLGTGQDLTVSVAPRYFDFHSSDPEVARVNELGQVTNLKRGNAVITAEINGIEAFGSIALNVVGNIPVPDTPPARDPANVVSIYSDAYASVSGFQPAVFNGPGAGGPIDIAVIDIAGNPALAYSNIDFVGLGWDGTVDVSGMSFLHLDVQVTQEFDPTAVLVVEIIDFGPDNTDTGLGGSDDTAGGFNVLGSELEEGAWIGIDIPLDAFTQGTGGGGAGSPNLSNVARVVFVQGGITDIFVDNIYFYKD
ncbi:MAG: hypothetical protein RLO81_15150 [Fulvivirga sp.]|uniref:hypothetical protein n=1 Tax=Fulvivirga sp. TaxID=1931237 RepID=UPI0032ECE02E